MSHSFRSTSIFLSLGSIWLSLLNTSFIYEKHGVITKSEIQSVAFYELEIQNLLNVSAAHYFSLNNFKDAIFRLAAF